MDSAINGAIDEISRKILRELQKDARLSFAELGRQVGLSPSATAERVRRLEDEGIIRGYRVDIDPRALGYGVIVLAQREMEKRRSPLV
jgi:Lrp/AsnC family leucine-responsive transcriptional regulator